MEEEENIKTKGKKIKSVNLTSAQPPANTITDSDDSLKLLENTFIPNENS